MRVLLELTVMYLFVGPAVQRQQGLPMARTWAPVALQMQNVNLHLNASVVLEIRHLTGEMRATGNSEPVTFDDLNSFETQISSAEIAISTKTLSSLLNEQVFAYPGAPLKNLAVTTDHGRIKETGTMHKGIDLPFEIEGKLDVTANGEIRLHADKISSAHVPFKGLMHLFGEDLAKLIHIKKDRGVSIEGDDIFLDPTRMLPPPRIRGRVTAIRVESDLIVQTFGSAAGKSIIPPYKASNYLYHRGGVLRFGKLTMTDADLEIVDESPNTPFEFSLPDYDRQLVAGYSKNTPSHGLIVFMPDLATVATTRH